MNKDPYLLTRTKGFFTRFGVRLWWNIPVSRQGKERIKRVVFTVLPFLFRHTKPFKNWEYTKRMNRQDFAFLPFDFPSHWPTERIDLEQMRPGNNTGASIQPLAIVIHVFYEEVFSELLQYFDQLRQIDCKLFIGTTKEKHKKVQTMAADSGFTYHLQTFENRGRDVLPFLKLSTLALEEGYPLILKLHTKKSDHRLTGELWRKEVFDELLNPVAVERILEVFARNPKLGLLGPTGHIVPMSLYYGGNARAVGYLSYRLGIQPQKLKNMHFVAGSMFYIRPQALKPLLAMKLDADLFEAEKGQHDGTMAHAVERIFALSNQLAGYNLADTTSSPEKPGLTVNRDHPYTW